METTMSQSLYQTLAPGEIRVLEPIGGSDGLSWTLRTVHIDEPELVFETLSYVWGSQAQTFPITCNEHTVYVHYNLYVALPYIAKRHRDGRSFPIWIDALCIDQYNEVEKLVQIGMMSEVYRRARTAWVWLGIAKQQDRIPEAISMLPRIIDASDHLHEGFTAPRTKEQLKADRVNTGVPANRYQYLDDSFGLNHLDPRLWNAIDHLINNPWCMRVWVIQEAVLANELRFLCGSHEIDGHDLVDAVCHRLFFAFIKDNSGRRVDHRFIHSRYVFDARRLASVHDESGRVEFNAAQLSRVARLTARKHACLHEQDRVLGLLGLVDENVAVELERNYRTHSSIPKLFTAFNTYLLGEIATNEISWWQWFNSAFTPTRRNDLPSWVSDLHRLGKEDFDRPVLPLMANVDDGSCHYRASKKALIVKWKTNPEEIVLQGVLVEEITLVHPMFSDNDTELTDKSGTLQEVVDIVTWERSVARNVIESVATAGELSQSQHKRISVDAYWRTLILDQTEYLGETLTVDAYHGYIAAYTNFVNVWTNSDSFRRYCKAGTSNFHDPPTEDEQNFRNLYDKTTEPLRNGSDGHRFWNRLSFNANRRLFSTKTGIFGMTHPDVQAGDFVCVLNGSYTPYIVRKVEGREKPAYRFVGEAYAHGLMYGEADKLQLVEEDLLFV